MSANYRVNKEEIEIYGILSKFVKIGKDFRVFFIDITLLVF